MSVNGQAQGSVHVSAHLSSTGGMTHIMVTAVPVKEEIIDVHAAACTCNPCECDPCTCGSSVASVKEEIPEAHSAACTCNPCECDPCTCGSSVASVKEEIPD